MDAKFVRPQNETGLAQGCPLVLGIYFPQFDELRHALGISWDGVHSYKSRMGVGG